MPELTFGAELRRLRLAAGCTPERLAEWALMPLADLLDIEWDRRVPRAREIDAIVEYLDSPATPLSRLRELAFVARGEQCPKCGFGRDT